MTVRIFQAVPFLIGFTLRLHINILFPAWLLFCNLFINCNNKYAVYEFPALFVKSTMFLVEPAAFYLYKCDISRHATDMGFQTSGRFLNQGLL